MSMTVRLIVNPSSGGGRSGRLLPKVVELMQAAGLEFHTIFTRSLEHADVLAREGVDRGYLVAPMGGDGIISAVCAAAADQGQRTGVVATVAVVPAGRGNDFARSIGVHSLESAVAAMSDGAPVVLDLGKVNDRLFVTVASLGLDSDVLHLSDRVRLIGGKSVYAYAAVRALTKWKRAEFTLNLQLADGSNESITVGGYNVVVANTAYYGGGMKIAPNALATDGLFQIVSVGDMPKRSLLRNLPKVFRGRHATVNGVRFWNASAVTVEASRPIEVYADGERVATTPVRMEIVPRALSLLMPPVIPA